MDDGGAGGWWMMGEGAGGWCITSYPTTRLAMLIQY